MAVVTPGGVRYFTTCRQVAAVTIEQAGGNTFRIPGGLAAEFVFGTHTRFATAAAAGGFRRFFTTGRFLAYPAIRRAGLAGFTQIFFASAVTAAYLTLTAVAGFAGFATAATAAAPIVATFFVAAIRDTWFTSTALVDTFVDTNAVPCRGATK